MSAPKRRGAEFGRCICGGSLSPSCYPTRASFQLAYYTGLCAACLRLAFQRTDADDARCSLICAPAPESLARRIHGHF